MVGKIDFGWGKKKKERPKRNSQVIKGSLLYIYISEEDIYGENFHTMLKYD